MKTYKTAITQYIAPEYGDSEKRYRAQIELELPFVPLLTKDIGLIHPDLGEYVWHVQTIHYNIGEDKFYLTINARWVQVWEDREYNHVKTVEEMENYVTYLKEQGWSMMECD